MLTLGVGLKFTYRQLPDDHMGYQKFEVKPNNWSPSQDPVIMYDWQLEALKRCMKLFNIPVELDDDL